MKKIHSHPISTASLLGAAEATTRLDDPVIRLLEAIGDSGSINRAARTVGLSYKAAWERLEAINNLSPEPLISRQTGGSGGGGTSLTEAGYRFLDRASTLQRHFRQLVTFFQETPQDALAMLRTLQNVEMKISARNVWLGNVEHIDKGAVNSVVTVRLKGDDTIASVITDNSVKRLGLFPGCEVLTIVKAPSVILSLDAPPYTISAGNMLNGTINRIVAGAVNDEVVVDIAGGNTVTSILTSASGRRMKLHQGMPIAVIIQESSVLLAVP